MEGLGERIRALRGAQTQTEFARSLGYSLRQASAWEREESTPPPEFFAKVARIYGPSVLQSLLQVTSDETTGTVNREDGQPYLTRDDQELAAALARHPVLKGAVKKVIELDDKFIGRAQALADAMAIPLEAACLVLLMKEAKQ